jgi:hypothetical protein
MGGRDGKRRCGQRGHGQNAHEEPGDRRPPRRLAHVGEAAGAILQRLDAAHLDAVGSATRAGMSTGSSPSST